MLKKLLLFSLFAFALAGCSESTNDNTLSYGTKAPMKVGAESLGTPVDRASIDHLHGVATLPGSSTLAVATHDGIFLWDDGQWYESNAVKHDYMGFTSSKDASYTSGHPAPGSGIQNPLGLMKSTDNGNSWESLSLLGEADFHLMAASFNGSTIYAWNMGRNSQMSDRGLYYTRNGSEWKESKMNGVDADPLVLMVHPFKDGTVLIGTIRDTYISSDFGNNFELLFEDAFITVGDFVKDADVLIAGTMDLQGQAGMMRYDFATGEQSELNAPPLQPNEVIAYMAVSGHDEKTVFIATPRRNIFISRDGGSTWDQILKN